jgi:hypothetical protein
MADLAGSIGKIIQEIIDLQDAAEDARGRALEGELAARKARLRRDALVSDLYEKAEARFGDPLGLMPAAGVAAVNRYLTREKRPIVWLASECHVSRPHLSLVMSRKREISPGLAADLAAVTGIDIELLWPTGVARRVSEVS